MDDYENLRVLWMRKLKALPDFAVHGSYADAESAWAALEQDPGDLGIVDWKLPGMDGVELIRRLKLAHPDLRTILITGHKLDDLPFAAFAAGADGFLLKPVEASEFPVRLREVCAGKCPVSAEVSRQLVQRLRTTGALHPPTIILSSKEAEVLALFGEGLDTKTVASRLNISPHTVVTHKRRAFAKLDAHNLATALHHWSHPGWR